METIFCVWDFLVSNVVAAAVGIANMLPIHYGMSTGTQLAKLILPFLISIQIITSVVDVQRVVTALSLLLSLEGLRLLLISVDYVRSHIPWFK